MSLLTWTPQMSVGVHQLDEDHKKLIAMINELHDGVLSGKSREAVGEVLRKLAHYTLEHFQHEERYFAQTNYPGAAAHKREHEILKAQAAQKIEKFLSGSQVGLSRELMNFLRDWWKHHILESDMQYVAHLKAHGIR
jgi:hemerythrin-like metal-binding protein